MTPRNTNDFGDFTHLMSGTLIKEKVDEEELKKLEKKKQTKDTKSH